MRSGHLFVVNDMFPFGEETFDTVYSGSVIHVIADEDELCGYLNNAWTSTQARWHSLWLHARD